MRRRRVGVGLLALVGLALLASAQEPSPLPEPDAPTILAEGRRLFEEGKALHAKRRFEEARKRFAQAGERFARAGKAVEEAETHHWIAACHLGRGRYPEACREAEEFLLRLRAVHGSGDHPHVARALNNLAYCLKTAGRPRDALPLYERGLAMWWRLHPDGHREVTTTLNNFAGCLIALGRAEEALPHLRKSLVMAEGLQPGDDPHVARGLNNLADCLRTLGRHAEALPLLERSLAMRRRLFEGDHPFVVRGLNNLGLCLVALGRPAMALPRFEEASAMRQRLHGGEHPSVAVGLNNLALCLNVLGRTDEALDHYRRALAIRERVYKRPHLAVVRGLSNVGQSLTYLGRPAEALPYLRRSVETARKACRGRSHPDVAQSLNGLARCLRHLGRPEEARPLYEEALAIRSRLFKGDHPAIVTGLNNLASCYMDADQETQAVPHLQAALEMSRRLGSRHTHVVAANLAKAYWNLHRLEEVVPLCAEAIDHIEARQSQSRGLTEEEQGLYFEALKRCAAFDLMLKAQLRLGRASEALRYLERGRARGVHDLLERSRFDPLSEAARRAEADGDEAWLAAVREVTRALERADREVGRRGHALVVRRSSRDAEVRELRSLGDALREARRAQREALRQRSRLIREEVPLVAPVEPAAIRAMLAEKERMLIYSLSDRGSRLLLVPPAGRSVRGFVLRWPDGSEVHEAPLAAAVDAYLARISDRTRAPAAIPLKLPEAGHRLFRALVPEEVWEEVRDLDRVYVVPHGQLHRLPFETLVVEAGKERDVPWLEAGPPIAYGTAGSVLAWCRKRRDEQERGAESAPDTIVALGDPVFSRDGSAALRRLPGSRREVLAIAEAVKVEKSGGEARVTLLLGEDATETKLRDLASQAHYLHLATHHLVDETERVSRSRLALTLPAAATAGDDGFLELVDLFERWRGRLDRCELVVLSGCETSRGHLQKDEGVFALPLGFLYAGAPAVVASLWRVDDESTAELMGDFYRRLAEGSPTLAAFTEARKALRKRQPHPYFWGPFVTIGDPR